jgi:anti-anti-sigma factor
MNDAPQHAVSVNVAASDDQSLTLEILGEVDLATLPEVRVATAVALAAHPADELVFDMSGVTLIDSTGLAFVRTLARSDSPRFVIVEPSPVVRRLLQLTLLDASIAIRPSVQV